MGLDIVLRVGGLWHHLRKSIQLFKVQGLSIIKNIVLGHVYTAVGEHQKGSFVIAAR